MNPDSTRIQILVVEDEAVLALDLAELLELEGYAVVGTAANGPQALELFQKHRVDLLLCDIRLQGPWDGIETARRLAAERPVPLVYLTALADRATLTRALPTAPAAYLAKPVSVAGLRAAIEVALLGGKPTHETTPAGPERTSEASLRETILRLDQHIFLKHNYRFVRLALADIVLLEADNTVTNLVTTGPHYSLRMSLTAALERLSYPSLVRVHRSFAINLKHVSAFSEVDATLHTHTVPLGRQYKADFLRQFQLN
ncbi:MAG: LytR/AlgR family response regulator transcription factor [Janthinobacterium lividum]